MQKFTYLFFSKEEMKSVWQAIPKQLVFLAIVGLSFAFNPLHAQTDGETCNDPIVISDFPFSDSGNTGDYGNNYSNNDVPPVASGAVTNGTGADSYLDGPEVVYAITPNIDGYLSISTTNEIGWVSLWVFKDCPFSSTVGYHTDTGGATREINNLPVIADETYYIVLSTWQSQLASTDFTIEIEGPEDLLAPLEDCIDANAGTILGDTEIEVCAGVAFSIEVSDASAPAEGLTRTWQSSPAGEDDWTDLNVSSYTLNLSDGVTEATDFRYYVACEEQENTSDIISVSLKPANQCYCIPEGSNANYYINNFTTSGGVDNIENLDSGAENNGYNDYTAEHSASQVRTEPINFQADFASGYTFGSKIWVDWNQDGQFSEDEIVYQSSSYTTSVSGSFEVPETATLGETRMRIGISYTPNSGPNNACESGSRAYEDYTFEVLALEDCEGIPIAGTVETEMEVCSEIAFILSTEGSSIAAQGLTRTWQSSPAGEDDWTDIEDSSTSDFTLQAGISENTDFRYVVSCSNSDETDISEVIEVTLKSADECYCTPNTNSTYYVSDFSTSEGNENIDNSITSAPSNGYGDYTDQKVAQIKTYVVDFSATMSSSTHGMKIWVDWNKDGNFSEDEIVYQTSSYSGAFSGSITVPESATEGETIMRVGTHVSNSSGPATACEDSTSSAIAYQDYTFEIIPLDDCEGTPVAGTVDTDLEVCSGVDFQLVTEGATSPANNLVRTWQSSPAGEDDWTDIEDSLYSNFTLSGGITEATDFRFKVQCGDDDIVYSDVIEVILKPGIECYCTPTGASNNSDEILNFSLDDFSNDSNPSEGTNGYSDYTDLGPITLIPGLDYVASLTSNTGSGNHGAAIWIDYNDDGFFSEDEKVTYIASTISGNSTVDFPAFVAEGIVGEHRLRVQYTHAQDGANLDPCNITTSYSETEDYMVLIVDVACFPPTGISIDYVTNNSAQVSWEANDETEWLVSYGPAGFDPVTEGESMTVTEPLADLTDLNDETTYEVYVQTLCDEEDSVVIGPRIFTTNITPPENTRLCDAIELTPNSGCVGGPYTNVAAFMEPDEPIGSCMNDYHGTKTVWFSFVATDTEAVITTDFNSTDIQSEIVVFEAPADCTDLTTLGEEVGCSNSGFEGIFQIDDLTIGDTYYVKIGGFNNTEGLFCLEVQMDEVEVCMDPTDLTIGEIGDTYVDISWTSTGTATQWEILYGLTEFDIETEGESMVVNSTEVSITDLQPETDYEVYVRAICADNSSSWVGPETFTTDEMGVTSPIFEDFSFYPNPVKEILNLKAESLIEKVEIFNLLGQKVLEVQPNNLESVIETDQLQSGIYLMKVTIEEVNKSFRVIKK